MESRGVTERAIKITASVGGFAGIANDLLNPLIDFGWYATYALLAILAICIVAMLIKPLQAWCANLPWPQPVAGAFKEYWAAPLLVVLVAMSAITAGAAILTEKNSNEGGAIAQVIPGVFELKQQLGVISSQLGDMQVTLGRIESTVKKETSDDPRKELQNRGIAWSDESFKEQIVACNKDAIGMFLQGGMRTNLYGGANQDYMMRIVHDTPADCRIWLLETLSNHGIVQFNRKFLIATLGSFANPQGNIPWLVANSYYGVSAVAQRNMSIIKAEKDQQVQEKLSEELFGHPNSMLMESGLLPFAIWEGDEKLGSYLISKGADCNERFLEDAAYPKSPTYTPLSEALRINNGSLPDYMKACA